MKGKINVAVFGGRGFIGGATVQKMLKMDDLEPWPADNYCIEHPDPGIAVPNVDVRVASEIGMFLDKHRPSTILWFPARQGYLSDHSDFANTQVGGTYALFEAIDDIDGYIPTRIVLASSQAVYEPGIGRHETSATIPPSVYGFSKLQQERAFQWFCAKRNIICVALRYSIVLGPGQSLQSSESGLIRNWYRAFQDGVSAEIYGDGEHRRDFVHIDDVVDANLAAMQFAASGVFNIGGQVLTIRRAFEVWQKITGCRDAVILGQEKRPGGEYSLTSCSNVAEVELRWKPRFRFEAMVRDFFRSVEPERAEKV